MVRGMTVVLFLLVVGCTGGTSAPQVPCTTPDRASQLLRLAQVETPPMALQQGITGNVVVRVTLDGSAAVTATQIVASPSAILNAAAMQAARTSTYQAGLQNCRPGGTLDITVSFP